jgi:hypothetical protein
MISPCSYCPTTPEFRRWHRCGGKPRVPWPMPYASEGNSTESLGLPEQGDNQLWTVAGDSPLKGTD